METFWTKTVISCVVLGILTSSFALGAEDVLSRRKRVIGGTSLARGDSPWLVLLRGTIVTQRLFGIIPISHRHVYCGGSLLNSRWVLTAAHCFDGSDLRDPDSWEVLLATVDLKVNLADRFMNLLGHVLGHEEWKVWEIDATRIIVYPYYKREELWYNDIALLKLEEPVPAGPAFDHIKKIGLPEMGNSSFPEAGMTCSMFGWGCTSAGGSVSKRAMSVDLPIEDDQFCRRFYRPTSMSGRLCAGFESASQAGGICQGDSGGPLVCRNENGDVIQVGVASFTSKDNPDRFPAVFTQVSDFVDWIKHYIKT